AVPGPIFSQTIGDKFSHTLGDTTFKFSSRRAASRSCARKSPGRRQIPRAASRGCAGVSERFLMAGAHYRISSRADLRGPGLSRSGHGANVLAGRNPRLPLRNVGTYQSAKAERTRDAGTLNEPPRIIRRSWEFTVRVSSVSSCTPAPCPHG